MANVLQYKKKCVVLHLGGTDSASQGNKHGKMQTLGGGALKLLFFAWGPEFEVAISYVILVLNVSIAMTLNAVAHWCVYRQGRK